MAKPRSNGDEPVEPTSASGVDRLTNVLALMLVKGMKSGEAILTLARSGFRSSEIAELLGTSTNTVSVTLYKDKQSAKKAKKPPREAE
jgi:DNA-directed RNA polymerase specialized sigma24 family protein